MSLSLAEPSLSLEGNDVLVLKSPLVYVWWRGDQAMYVGVATRGASRPFSPEHHRMNEFADGDRLDFYACSSGREACTLESRFIEDLEPEMNVHGGTGGKGPNPVRTPETAARMYGVPVEAVMKACALGELAAELVDGSYRIQDSDAQAWSENYRRADPDALLSIREVTEQYDLEKRDVRAWIRKEALPHYRVFDRLIRIRRGDLEEIL